MEHSTLYYPAIWLFIAALVTGILIVTRHVQTYGLELVAQPDIAAASKRRLVLLGRLRRVLETLTLVLVMGGLVVWYLDTSAEKQAREALREQLTPAYDPGKFWTAPDPALAGIDPEADLIAYGRDLIAHTQDYFGQDGLVRPGSINALNCQSCHLDAGAKPFGNNYFAVQSTYPRMRARSGTLETIPRRINDCFERSLNGQALDTTSREMKAIVAYIRWLGTGVPKDVKPKGTGITAVPFLDRAADPARGKEVYAAKCASCHGADGSGLPMPDSPRRYPPLWGPGSYNQAAGLFRLSRFAGYVKSNMPFGATYDNPQLSDEEAWDLAAFVNSQPRPAHPFLAKDWPDVSKKPFDHPFGPYADTIPEAQHKYGPFKGFAK